MHSAIAVRNILPDTELVCYVVSSLFTNEECEKLLNSEMKRSFEKAISDYPTYYRNNHRLVIDDPKLSLYLFEKVKSYLPSQIEIKSSIESENGVWALSELNSRIRFCKYSANQYFHRHLDGVHYCSEVKQSKLTFMIYLNSANEFEGGRTLFYKTKDATEIWASYVPKQGDLIVFDHYVWHEGEEVKRGEKFVLRSDILYTRDGDRKPKKAFSGHLGYIWRLLMFDDETILSGGRDKVIHVWNVNGDLCQSLTGHSNSILCLEKLNENSFLSGSRDRQIKVWRRKEDRTFELANSFTHHSAVVLSICRLTDHLFASSGGDYSIKIANLSGEIKLELIEHTNWVWQVVKLFETFIASCSEDSTIKIWNYELPSSVKTYMESCSVLCLIYDSRTNTLISGNLEGVIVLRQLSYDFNETIIGKIQAHRGIVRTILKLNEKFMVSGGEDNRVKVWDIANGSCETELQHNNFVQSLALREDSKLLSASYDGTIQVWNLAEYMKKS